jgi:PAS domain S-box-containing protein
MISVLYVEDDTSLLEIGKFLLEKDGSIAVDTCSSVNDAIKQISGKRYDIILSDYAMPGTNGIKFLKSLRSGGDTTPFFFFAGKGRKSVIIEALNLGADFYLEKAGNAKVQFEELMHEIQRAAERKSTFVSVDQSTFILESVLESVAEGVLVIDPFGKITTFNQNFLSLLKIPADQIGIGNDSPVLLKYIEDHLEDPDDFSRKTETMTTDPGITCQGTIHAQEGQVFSWSSRALKTGDTISGRIWSFCDISEQTRTGLQLATVQEQLKAREEELHHLREELETNEAMIQKGEEIIDIITRETPDGILTSIGGNIVKANEQFADMLGHSTSELAGRSLLGFMSPDSAGEVMTSIRSGSRGRYEYSVLHRNGSSFRVEAAGYPVRYRGDTILVSIVRRVSDTAVHQEKSPDSSRIQVEVEPEQIEAGSSPERISEPSPDGEMEPEHVSGVSVPAVVTTKEHDRISLTWEVDDADLTADAGENQPSRGNDNSSLITEIEDVIGPDTSTSSPCKRPWYTPDFRQWFSYRIRKKK